jgi:uncharacterized protein
MAISKNVASGRENRTSAPARRNAAVMLLAAVFPSLAAWLYFVALAGYPSGVQQAVYSGLKIVQFTLPVAWLLLTYRLPSSLPAPRSPLPALDSPLSALHRSLPTALAFGAGASAAMLVGYFAWLRTSGMLLAAAGPIAQTMDRFHVDTPARFIALGGFYCLIHSLLEEYYWRWFLFGGLRRLMPLWPAILLSSLAFAGHHVIVLATYFGLLSWATVLFSAAVALGGAVWAWLYHRSGSLLGPWLSHLMIDAAIFVIGYDLLQRL